MRATRRQLLRPLALVGAGFAGAVAIACDTTRPPSSSAQGTPPAILSWDSLLAAARAEGKVVVSGPPRSSSADRQIRARVVMRLFNSATTSLLTLNTQLVSPEYVLKQRLEARDFYASILR